MRDKIETIEYLETEIESHYKPLADRLKEESAERKRLFNQLQEIKGNIRVFCRVRPLTNEEQTRGEKDCVSYVSSFYVRQC